MKFNFEAFFYCKNAVENGFFCNQNKSLFNGFLVMFFLFKFSNNSKLDASFIGMNGGVFL
ncbi:MAG: hypothetical protein CML04_08820 [Pseudozobellia sp.]|nr:hypothetical protein [Pseudozobellia sp.]MBG48740.1 hypothetical protein [Pseudozobellia sp.]